MKKSAIGYEGKYSTEEQKMADYLINLEKEALERWFKGDTSGYRELWSKHSFTYFDGANPDRVEDYDSIIDFLDTIEGKLFAKHYDFCCPRVQFGTDMAVLTYQLFAKTTLIDMQYNCIEVFQKELNDWQVVHSTWSFIRPMDMDFSAIKEIV